MRLFLSHVLKSAGAATASPSFTFIAKNSTSPTSAIATTSDTNSVDNVNGQPRFLPPRSCLIGVGEFKLTDLLCSNSSHSSSGQANRMAHDVEGRVLSRCVSRLSVSSSSSTINHASNSSNSSLTARRMSAFSASSPNLAADAARHCTLPLFHPTRRSQDYALAKRNAAMTICFQLKK
mmetsp:Transcript_28965/g.40723  ORF Transcript_28965/g.40723 Transcript_28965/m.40723 type:complete len:178 (+) Transcript_28965:1-534(+)